MTAADLLAPPAIPPGLPAGAVVASIVVPSARMMPAAELTRATNVAYDELRRRLQAAGGTHLVRVWNYIPALLDPADAGGHATPAANRYAAFNAGRYAAMRGWFGDAGLTANAPAGTGVGTPGDDLVIHALATPQPGVAVQNPRQTPSVHYSARYGDRPPCFARATRVGRVLLVSGTAAIAGEDSVAPDDLSRQLDLTLDHLRTLAGGLGRYVSLRAYVPRAADAATVAGWLAAAFGHLPPVTPVVVDLCRRELRVEIEGVADETRPL